MHPCVEGSRVVIAALLVAYIEKVVGWHLISRSNEISIRFHCDSLSKVAYFVIHLTCGCHC